MTKRCDADTTVIASDIEGVFDRDRKTVEGTEGTAGSAKMGIQLPGASKSGTKQRLGEAGGELMGNCSSLEYLLVGLMKY